MEISGIHSNDILQEHYDCRIRIEDGIIGVYKQGETDFNNLNQPINCKKWNFRKIKHTDWASVKPKFDDVRSDVFDPLHTHLIEYKTRDGKKQKIYIKPTVAEIINIKAQQKPWWSGKNKKSNERILFFILGVVLTKVIEYICSHYIKL